MNFVKLVSALSLGFILITKFAGVQCKTQHLVNVGDSLLSKVAISTGYLSSCTKEDNETVNYFMKEITTHQKELADINRNCTTEKSKLQLCLDVIERKAKPFRKGYKCTPGLGWHSLFDDWKLTWWKAEQSCVADGGHLFAPDSTETFKLLHQMLVDSKTKIDTVWLGFRVRGGQLTNIDEVNLKTSFKFPWPNNGTKSPLDFGNVMYNDRGELVTLPDAEETAFYVCKLD